MKGSISRFLFFYTLNAVFEGNKLRFSRQLNIRRPDVYRMIDRFDEGGYSATAIEAVLQYFARQKLSLDRVIDAYNAEPIDTSSCRDICDEISYSIQTDATCFESVRDTGFICYDFFMQSHEYQQQLKNNICKKYRFKHLECDFCNAGDDGWSCPCTMFSDFYERIRDDMISKLSM